MDFKFTDPILAFQNWYAQVQKSTNPEPTAMTLSTVNGDGHPTSRVVLLKQVLNGEFYFFTNYMSEKSQQIQKHPFAALNFHWTLPFHRQVRIAGQVRKTSVQENIDYFKTRPRGSQLGAWASKQSSILKSREELELAVHELDKKYANTEVPCPPHWGGFIITPLEIEFWEGKESRLHDRFLFKNKNKEWSMTRLYP